jgi:hypothetical protein
MENGKRRKRQLTPEEPGTDDAPELAPNTHQPVPTPRSALG